MSLHISRPLHIRFCCCHWDLRPNTWEQTREDVSSILRMIRRFVMLAKYLMRWRTDAMLVHVHVRAFVSLMNYTHCHTHRQELQMQSELSSTASSVFHLEHEQVLEENWPASTCSAVVKPNTNSTVIEAKCLLGGLLIGSLLAVGQMSVLSKFPPITLPDVQTNKHNSDRLLRNKSLLLYV